MIKQIIVYAPLPFINNKGYKEAHVILEIFKVKTGINFNIFELDPNQLNYYKNLYDTDIKEFPVILIWLQDITNANSTSPDYSFYLNTDLDRQNAKKWLSDYHKNPSGAPSEVTTRFICNEAGKIITLKKGDIGFDTSFDDAAQAQESCVAAKSSNKTSIGVILGLLGIGAFLYFRKKR